MDGTKAGVKLCGWATDLWGHWEWLRCYTVASNWSQERIQEEWAWWRQQRFSPGRLQVGCALVLAGGCPRQQHQAEVQCWFWMVLQVLRWVL
jgi:hypothetical protein